jgi:RNA polymerase sigma-70 factor (ECF subfamily)
MSETSRSLVHTDLLVADGDTTVESAAENAKWSALAAMMARVVRRQCPAWLRDCAQDIAQAALTKVMLAVRRSEGDQPVSPFYLYRAAHSALVDEIRRRTRRQEVSLDGVLGERIEPGAFEPRSPDDPHGTVSLRELGGAVRDCLVKAKRERRLAVTLYLLGHSVPEAAGILGWDEKRTENLVYRGLADLRQCLVRKGHKP